MENYFRMSHKTGTNSSTGILTQLLQNMLNRSTIQTCKLLLPVKAKGVNCLLRHLPELQCQLAPEDATARGSRLVGLLIEIVR
jgi:hypothetical protein